MTIEEAVKIYNIRKDQIDQLDKLIKRIVNRSFTQRLADEYIVYPSEFDEIAMFLKDLRKRFENDLKSEFDMNCKSENDK